MEGSSLVANFSRVVEAFAYDILAFCDWSERASLPCVNKSVAFATVYSQYHYRWMCRALQQSFLLHVPEALPLNVTRRDLFFELWKYRHVFVPKSLTEAAPHGQQSEGEAVADINTDPERSAASGDEERDDNYQHPTLRRERCEIAVAVRFRPALDRQRSRTDKRTKITLPLYQRLQLIRAQNAPKNGKGKLGIAESLQVLKENGEWFADKWAEEDRANASGEEEGAVGGAGKSGSKGFDQGYARVESIDTASGDVVVVAPSVGIRRFNFQSVVPPAASQTYVYDTAPRQLIADFLNGFNSSIIVYGQTGSGKTYTMFGKESTHHKDTESSAYIRSKFRDYNRQRGVVIRACEDVFGCLAERQSAAAKQGLHFEAEVSVTYVEIFGDDILDLLDDKKSAAHDHTRAVAAKLVLSGANSVGVKGLSDVLTALEVGERRKRTAATAMNERSSRAHTLFILTLKQTTQHASSVGGDASMPGMQNTVTSKLFLADLGGSEQVKKSLVSGGRMDAHIGHVLGDQMREAVYINQGLFALKKCIRRLNKQDDYIPYQDSKLTRLLAGGLGGDSKSMVIICASMDEYDATETLQALRFGDQCQRVTTDATIVQQQVTGLIQKIDERIHELETAIREKEHWEDIKVRRVDENVEEGTFEATLAEKEGGEVVTTTRLKGAEAEREELVALLHRRAALSGEVRVGAVYLFAPYLLRIVAMCNCCCVSVFIH
eukprot:INCI11267.2.p1 GENE.INCI11267.2~~INCI11267.2.p1  ORF type:complete len:720 (+),score=139.61 INCI11267.2:206-2365(+)